MSLGLLQVPGVSNGSVIVRKGSEVFDADIYSNVLACPWERFCFDFTGNGNVPSIGFMTDRGGFGSSL